MTTQHTPGPWHVVDENHILSVRDEFSPGRPSGSPLVIVAREPRSGAGRGQSVTWHGYTERQLADARLIAAAPDLLAALEECIEIFSSVDDQGVLDQARAAIAKVKHG